MATYTMFVYGTLKKTQPNHKLMDDVDNGFAKFLGRGHTVNKYPLVIASLNNTPFVLYKEGYGKVIQGELYEVDEKMLSVLDRLEDHPRVYEREITPVMLTEDDQQEARNVEKRCWLYFLKRFKPELLELPCHENYDSILHGYRMKENQLAADVRNAVLK